MATPAAAGQGWSSAAGAAFLGVVVLGGGNAVAVRILNAEVAPLWGAALRFGVAAVVLLAVVLLTRTPLPHGRAFIGSVLYGAVGFAGAFGSIHWALVQVPAANVQIVLALVPLLTFLFAVGQGLERFRPASLAGALVAFAGIAVIFGEGLGAATPIASLAAVAVGAACMAESNVIVKRFPKCHPVANNAVAMTIGAAILVVVSFVTGERHAWPSREPTWLALTYVSLAGSVSVFSLFVYVVQRSPASAASFVMLLMPLVTVTAAAVVTGAPINPAFITGGAVVLAGVTIGAIWPARQMRANDVVAPRLSSSTQPGCA